MLTGTHYHLVEKCLFTTMLTWLKAAVLYSKSTIKHLLKPNYLTQLASQHEKIECVNSHPLTVYQAFLQY